MNAPKPLAPRTSRASRRLRPHYGDEPMGCGSDMYWNLRDVQRSVHLSLQRHRLPGIREPVRFKERLIAEHLGRPPLDLYLRSQDPLSQYEYWLFNTKLAATLRAMEKGAPAPIGLKERLFYGRVFKIAPGVFLPRNESQNLVSVALHVLSAAFPGDGNLLAADLCTGSGNVGITLALENSHLREVDLVDFSPRALQCARKNARQLGVEARLNVLRRNLFTSETILTGRQYALIVGNPPYDPSAKVAGRLAQAAEPRGGFDGGDDGLAVIRAILKMTERALHPQGALVLECAKTQEKAVLALCAASPHLKRLTAITGMTGRSSVIVASADENFPLERLPHGPYELQIETLHLNMPRGEPLQISAAETRAHAVLVHALDRLEQRIKALSLTDQARGSREGVLYRISKTRSGPTEEKLVETFLSAVTFLEANGQTLPYFNIRHLERAQLSPMSIPDLTVILVLMQALADQITQANLLLGRVSPVRRTMLSASIADFNKLNGEAHDFMKGIAELVGGWVSTNRQWINTAASRNWINAKHGLAQYSVVMHEWERIFRALGRRQS